MPIRCGTEGYIAPEIEKEQSLIGPEIDMWAFGVMLYEMCTAYKPTVVNNFEYGKHSILTHLTLVFGVLGSGDIPFLK